MDNREFGRIKETARIQSIDRNEVAPVLPAVSEIESQTRSPEATIAGCDAPGRRREALA